MVALERKKTYFLHIFWSFCEFWGYYPGEDFSGVEKNEEPGGKQAKLFSTFFTNIKK